LRFIANFDQSYDFTFLIEPFNEGLKIDSNKGNY